ncbi:MAG: hypothetical protein LBS61_00205 [Endomicrobium sp.]|nr:hypothetical protein [Endomicrobium sp.]
MERQVRMNELWSRQHGVPPTLTAGDRDEMISLRRGQNALRYQELRDKFSQALDKFRRGLI